MIKFFRRIRQKLLSDKKFSQYFLYAAGEIILVVIGILIAVQINSWNEDRKNAIFEKRLLVELNKTLIANYDIVNMAIEGNKKTQRSCEIILKSFNQNLAYHDSLDIHFEYANTWWKMLINASAYEKAKNYGLDFIENQETKEKLMNLYESLKGFGTRMDDRQSLYYYNTVTPILIELFQSVDKTWHNTPRGNIPNNYEELKKDKRYRTILRTSIGERENYNQWIGMTLSEMKSLEERLKEEIDARN